MTGEDVVAEARTWMGTRYRHQAALKGVATDCIGLVYGIAAALGIAEASQWDADPLRKSHSRRPDGNSLSGKAEQYLTRVRGDWQLGDVLLLRLNAPDPNHFAIVSALDPVYIVHAYASARQVVENRLDRDRVVCAYRFKGL